VSMMECLSSRRALIISPRQRRIYTSSTEAFEARFSSLVNADVPQPEPIKLEGGKTLQVVLSFDDSTKIP
jgi:hypothetical protein